MSQRPITRALSLTLFRDGDGFPTRRHMAVLIGVIVLAASALATSACGSGARPGKVPDEAQRAHRTAASFPAADEDYFKDMDGGLPLTREEVQGRNMWLVWTGGNDRFWDAIGVSSVGSLDYLKTLSSHPTLPYSRDSRFRVLGLVNEPCYKKATGPDPARYGLWLDVRDPSCPADPFANAQKYPGVALGSRGKTMPVGSYYGEPTGIVGLRLFPNPDFDEGARKKWDSERFYNDPDYYFDRSLVRPYRVGVSCGFCHVGPDPTNPPADPGESEVGESQFHRRRAVFLGRPHLQLAERQQPAQLLLPAAAHLSPRHPRHLARLQRQHQQSADDERRVSPRRAHGAGEEVGEGDDRRRRTSSTSSSTTSSRPAIRSRSSSSRHRRSGHRVS